MLSRTYDILCVWVSASLLFWMQITIDVVQIIDNVTRWPDDVTNANASRFAFVLVKWAWLHCISIHIQVLTLFSTYRIIEAFEDILAAILLNENFVRLLFVRNDVAILAERVRLSLWQSECITTLSLDWFWAFFFAKDHNQNGQLHKRDNCITCLTTTLCSIPWVLSAPVMTLSQEFGWLSWKEEYYSVWIYYSLTKQIARDDLVQNGRTFGVSASDDGPGIY